MLSKKVSVELIQYGSREYQQACKLRYRLFYAEHNLPWEIVWDNSDVDCFHAAIIHLGSVVAYAQLLPQSNLAYQIRQMVVEPSHQQQNLGKQILLVLINLAQQQGATSLCLNSRLSAVGFYQKLGFQSCGVEFPSATTGIIHIPMRQKL